MYSGRVSKMSEVTVASAASIEAKADIVRITGTTTINTIQQREWSGPCILIPTDGAVTLGTSGNILVGIIMAQNRAVQLTFVKSLGKWVIESGV